MTVLVELIFIVYFILRCKLLFCRVFMESKEKYVGVVEKVEVGMVCLARFSQDELYYRAKITDIYPSGIVIYLCLSDQKIYSYPPDIRSLPPKVTSLIRPDGTCTEIDEYYYFISLSERTLSYKVIFIVAEGVAF